MLNNVKIFYNLKKNVWIETKYKDYSKFEFLKTHEFYNGMIFKKNDIIYGNVLENNIIRFKRNHGPSIIYFENGKLDTYQWILGTNTENSFRKNGPTLAWFRHNKAKYYFPLKGSSFLKEENYWNN